MTGSNPAGVGCLDTPVGPIEVWVNADGAIVRVGFADAASPGVGETGEAGARGVRQLQEYFSGERRSFDLELDPEGSDFEKQVWVELQQIPFGTTTTYGETARTLGDPGASRAVGLANASNPVAIIIPCHRVIGADGDLTGYAGGLWRKKWLLAHEAGQLELEF